MNNIARALRQALTVARRDFIATVFTPTFLIFLMSPMLTILFGALGGLGANSMTQVALDRARITVIAPPEQTATFIAADKRLRDAFPINDEPPRLETIVPAPDPAAQAQRLLRSRDSETTAVLYGPLAAPTILYASGGGGTDADYLGVLADDVLRSAQLGPNTPSSSPTKIRVQRTEVTKTGHSLAAMSAVFAIFLLTLFLAGLTMGTMAEERSNKVIEVLAAAVPLESVFFGKLIGMFGVAILFVTFWGTVATQIAGVLPPGTAAALTSMAPAVGKPMFVLLFLVYFILSYLLMGAVYLIVGAQAATQRELQMLALPMTVIQMANVGLSSVAASQPDSTVALIAEIFPFSSPLAMAARAANLPDLWPHALAIGWQLLWVSLVISFGARWFRRGVLKSGGGPRKRRTAAAGS